MTAPGSLRVRLRFGVQQERMLCCCLIERLNAMAFQSRFLLIRELSLSLLGEKYPLLMCTVANWGLSILRPAFAGQRHAARLKLSTKRTSWSLTCSRNIGASYATTTTPDLMKE